MKKSRRIRLLVWGGLGAIAILALIRALQPQPLAVDAEAVSRRSLRVTLDQEGRTRVRDKFIISAPVAGRLQRIKLEPGDPVAAGNILVEMLPDDPPPLDARNRAEAKAQVESARANLERAEAEREKSLAEEQLARTDLERARALFEKGVVARAVLDAAETRARTYAMAVEAAVAASASAAHELERAQALLIEPDAPGRRAAANPGPAIMLRSPADGVVLRRLRESEAAVPAGEPLVEIGNPSNLEVIADYLSTDAVKISPGMQVLIDQWGGAAVLSGRVRRVEPSGFMKISALGVEEQRVWVVIDFDSPPEAWKTLGDGYRVEVRVIEWEGTDVLTVPVGALFRQDDAWAVYVIENGVARLQKIEIGRRNGMAAQVLTGLSAGERVIVHPPDSLREGLRVTGR